MSQIDRSLEFKPHPVVPYASAKVCREYRRRNKQYLKLWRLMKTKHSALNALHISYKLAVWRNLKDTEASMNYVSELIKRRECIAFCARHRYYDDYPFPVF